MSARRRVPMSPLGDGWTSQADRAESWPVLADPGPGSPRRVRLRRARGWRKPAGAVVVSRPTRWGNPFRVGAEFDFRSSAEGRLVGRVADRGHAVRLFTAWLGGQPQLREEIRSQLRGRDLACWCPEGAPCHADVLLVVANGGRS